MTLQGRIAYVDLNGRLLTIAPDGADEQLLAESDRVFQFPAWSPAAPNVAVIGSNENGAGLYVFRDNKTAAFRDPELYYNHTELPIYHYWSPDGRYLSFLTTHRQGLALRLVNLQGRGYLLTIGQPLFWCWTNDGQIFMHSGMAGPEARLTFLAVDGDAWGENIAAPGYFQAPGISVNGRYWAFAESTPFGDSHIVIEKSGTDQRLSFPVQSLACFSWSPTEPWLAFLTPMTRADRFYGPLSLVNAETGEMRCLVEDVVFAFFWSPNGRYLATFTLSPPPQAPVSNGQASGAFSNGRAAFRSAVPEEQLLFEVNLVDAVTGKQRLLTRFQPNPIFLNQLLPFFDQYALSHRLWSPDGRALVLPHVVNHIPQLLIVPVDGEPSRLLAPGLMASWSWV